MSKRKLPVVQVGNFKQVINQALKEKRHVTYLKQVLKDFDQYKKTFNHAFTLKNSLKAIYVFRAKYIRKTSVWRDIAILGNQTFCNLAEAIIYWMGWDNDHMHGFSIKKVNNKIQGRYTSFSIYAPGWEDDPHPTFKTDKIKIADIDYKKNPKWNFVFDFGDGHEFDIELRNINSKITKKDFPEPLPTCIDQRGVAPFQYPPLDEDE
ncbi:plasmid pRiA4b ORF-3 family protein [Patescibacteria group bacterium]|nr:plasmid pRiA4b ORF-3 family protein [Patescibacteria group bacterium]